MANDLSIIIRLSGGLGNQLHQYAYGYFLAKQNKAHLFIDTSFYNLDSTRLKITRRKYELGNLMTDAKELRFLFSNHNILRLVLKFPLLKKILTTLLKTRIIEVRMLEDELRENENYYYLLGVFGTVNDYLKIKEDLKRQFYPNQEIIDKIESTNRGPDQKNKIAIHVRRSDYLNKESIHELLPLAYYHKAINFIKTVVSNPVFHIFGDDQNWIKENFDLTDGQFELISFTGEYNHLADFYAMVNCQHCIISNSTFAWWAAFLNPNENKIVVAPALWLKGDAVNIEETYLTNWHVI